MRAAIDRILGGVGIRKSKPRMDDIELGDTVDFFKVVKIEQNKMIRLKAEHT
jgi:hypothetical protein